jgi:hypothetical protein
MAVNLQEEESLIPQKAWEPAARPQKRVDFAAVFYCD